MNTFDTDGDGQINFEEYQAMRTLMDQRFVKFQNQTFFAFSKETLLWLP